MQTRPLLTAITLAFCATCAMAQTNAPTTVQRDINQQSRIERGLQSGQLTQKEAARLERGQARTDRHEAAAARDGHVSAREQARLQRQHDRQSKKIFKQKHDAQQKG